MIQLKRNGMDQYPWDGTYVWVNSDHITFLVPGINSERLTDKAYTIITCLGGGRTYVHETPEEILKMMTQWVKVPV
jgi:hypothetical protein